MQSLSPYPSLTLEFEHFFPIAKLYGINLSDANHKAWGAQITRHGEEDDLVPSRTTSTWTL